MFFFFCAEIILAIKKPTAEEEKLFVDWMRNTNQYFTGEDYFIRINNFLSNVDQISKHNKQNVPYKLFPNHFSHLSRSEIHAIFKFKDFQPHPRNTPRFSDFIPPDSVDWRLNNSVTPIKNQGSCGSCWAFSSTAVLEGLLARTTKELHELSPQALIDCCDVCNGCYGCDPIKTLAWMIEKVNGSLPLLEDYPFLEVQGVCDSSKFSKVYGNLKAFDYVDFCNETDLQVKVAEYGPVLAVMKANVWQFIYYTGGIIDIEGCSQFDYDHGVVVIGYGTENNNDFWIIKNSMGTKWGEEGYLRLARNKNNMCGIASRALYANNEPLD